MASHCEHGYRIGKRCPVCKEATRADSPTRRSVYEDRPGAEDEWHYIGEVGGALDFRRVGGWKPLGEFLTTTVHGHSGTGRTGSR